jgi:PBP1b-binding outer membrane lipoprotein LpoB
MKTRLAIVTLSALILASCAAGKKTTCDAYGNTQPAQNSELATTSR